MTTLADIVERRPARADARRNYDALIAAARTAFAELGPTAPLEEIARRANVGIATLYRNFPTRDALIEGVYFDEVEGISVAAEEFAALPPWEGLRAWLDRFVSYAGTKRVLLDALGRQTDAIRSCRDVLYAAGGPLVARAQAAGVVRKDTDIDDIMRMVTGISAYGFATPEQRDRVLSMALDGLRVTGK
jgi:AcrR family transcriptional regulator